MVRAVVTEGEGAGGAQQEGRGKLDTDRCCLVIFGQNNNTTPLRAPVHVWNSASAHSSATGQHRSHPLYYVTKMTGKQIEQQLQP